MTAGAVAEGHPEMIVDQAEFDALAEWNDYLIWTRALELGLPADMVADATARISARLMESAREERSTA